MFPVLNITVTGDNCVRAQKRTNGQTIEKVLTQSLHRFDVSYCSDIDKRKLDDETGSMRRQPHNLEKHEILRWKKVFGILVKKTAN